MAKAPVPAPKVKRTRIEREYHVLALVLNGSTETWAEWQTVKATNPIAAVAAAKNKATGNAVAVDGVDTPALPSKFWVIEAQAAVKLATRSEFVEHIEAVA